ncbi:hypothetical protein Ahy_A03g013849 [Arachis hypogaea]|uniref:SWIM-type domain-containing protein n=1 Tax=Arachis hypogaea TaxID=3818 RepID=A0A445DWB6_ARAHY|nr:hypothetical protein Ahy_A03g013849 [Arachis hypogaea]
MTFNMLEDAAKFYKDYSKTAERRDENLKYLRPRRQTPQLNLYTHIEGHWCLYHFKGRVASFTSIMVLGTSTGSQGTPRTIQREGELHNKIKTHFALGYTVYEVVEQISNSTFNKFAVAYDSLAAKVKCQCLLFESRGILCRHSLSASSFERVNKVSP